MKLKRSSSILLVLGIALVTCSFQSCGSSTTGLKKKDSGGDDQMIVVAGGSLYIGSKIGGGQFDPDDPDPARAKDLVHSYKDYYVTRVDVTDLNDNMTSYPFIDDKPVTVDIAYCRYKPDTNICVGGTIETVTFKTTVPMHGQGLVVTSDKAKMARATRLIPPVLFAHPRRKKSMYQVFINTTKVAECGENGECSLTIHYCQTADCK